ncbi:hypothetical protein [Pseudonocardia acaciae]|uniref:hypothetical protein n=1 Tax=Pseudonocardia acaciae TaxID=551276 RepID=UPI0007E8E5FE|nr:hypothetical protein [Pseudonocardia acaciae]
MLLRTRWAAGPDRPVDGDQVLVSVTRFDAASRVDLPGIYRAGLALRSAWPELPGAVGVWLWSQPLAGSSGSVSVWRSAGALGAFVGLPEHVRIMRRYRSRGVIRATTWTTGWGDPVELWARARRWLAEARA